jgi:hypothetical protein
MKRGWTAKLWIETCVAAASGLLFLATLIESEWIELVFHVDPDGGSGALEWAISGSMLAVALVSGVLARLEWRQLSASRA